MILPEFINFGPNELLLKDITDVLQKVQEYVIKKGFKDPVLCSFEDARWEDPANQRFDIVIEYIDDDTCHRVRQKLLILKGEVIDGNTFHKRFSEFY